MSERSDQSAPSDEWLAAVRRLVEAADPVPGWVLEAAQSVLDWRQVDAVLADLAYDSELHDPLAAGVRHGGGGARLLTFEDPRLSVDIEVHRTEGAVRLVGQLAPAGAVELTVRHRGGDQRVAIDPDGRFSVDGVAPGPLKLVVRLADDTAVQTSSVVV